MSHVETHSQHKPTGSTLKRPHMGLVIAFAIESDGSHSLPNTALLFHPYIFPAEIGGCFAWYLIVQRLHVDRRMSIQFETPFFYPTMPLYSSVQKRCACRLGRCDSEDPNCDCCTPLGMARGRSGDVASPTPE